MVVTAGAGGVDGAPRDVRAGGAGALAVVERRFQGDAAGAGLHVRAVGVDVEALARQRGVDVEAGGAGLVAARRGGHGRAAAFIAGLADRAGFLAHRVGHGERAGRGAISGVIAVDVEVAVAGRGPDGAVGQGLCAVRAGRLAVVERGLQGDVAGLGAGAGAGEVVILARLRGVDADAGSAGRVVAINRIGLAAAARLAAHAGGTGAKARHQRARQRAGGGAGEVLDAAAVAVMVIPAAVDGVDHAVGDGTADGTGGLAARHGLLQRHGIGAGHALTILVVVIPCAVVGAVDGDAGNALAGTAATRRSALRRARAGGSPAARAALKARRQRLRQRARRGVRHARTGGVGVVIGAAAGGVDDVVGRGAAIRAGWTTDVEHGPERHALGVLHAVAGGVGVVVFAMLRGVDVDLIVAARGG